jgi:flagellar basal body-associated protein FliL
MIIIIIIIVVVVVVMALWAIIGSWMGDQPVARFLHTHRTTQTE